jgi:hypothetical protein
MVTRGKTSVFKPWTQYVITIFSSSQPLQALLAFKEPRGFKSAVKHPEWLSAINSEIQALQKNDTWTMVPHSTFYNMVGCR